MACCTRLVALMALLLCSVGAQAQQVTTHNHHPDPPPYNYQHHEHHEHQAYHDEGPYRPHYVYASPPHYNHDYDHHHHQAAKKCAREWPVPADNVLSSTPLPITVTFNTSLFPGNDFAFDDRSCDPSFGDGPSYESYNTVFFKFTPTTSAAININTCNTTGTPVQFVFREDTCFGATPPGVFGECTPWLAYLNDEGCDTGDGSSLDVQLNEGVTYIIAVGSFFDVDRRDLMLETPEAPVGELKIKVMTDEEVEDTRRKLRAKKPRKAKEQPKA